MSKINQAIGEAKRITPSISDAERAEINNSIDLLVGKLEWDGAKHVMVWPEIVREAAGLKGTFRKLPS